MDLVEYLDYLHCICYLHVYYRCSVVRVSTVNFHLLHLHLIICAHSLLTINTKVAFCAKWLFLWMPALSYLLSCNMQLSWITFFVFVLNRPCLRTFFFFCHCCVKVMNSFLWFLRFFYFVKLVLHLLVVPKKGSKNVCLLWWKWPHCFSEFRHLIQKKKRKSDCSAWQCCPVVVAFKFCLNAVIVVSIILSTLPLILRVFDSFWITGNARRRPVVTCFEGFLQFQHLCIIAGSFWGL